MSGPLTDSVHMPISMLMAEKVTGHFLEMDPMLSHTIVNSRSYLKG